jgi:uncharacterized membrane protein YgdD (TMEM256/DUF423 family)
VKDGNRIAAAGALLAALGVALGAFGSHGLRGTLSAEALGWWNIAVQYQMWSALGLVALGASTRRLGLAAALIGIGALIFSGSLYALALTGARWLGMVTPLGGLAMITGWSLAAWRLARGS